MHRTNPKVDEHLRRAERRQPELKKPGTILLDGPLLEQWKWGKVLAAHPQRKGVE